MARSAASQPLRFTAVIHRLAMNYCVDVPTEVSGALGGGTYVPVAGTADGEPFRTRLTPRGGGAYRLFLNPGSTESATRFGCRDT